MNIYFWIFEHIQRWDIQVHFWAAQLDYANHLLVVHASKATRFLLRKSVQDWGFQEHLDHCLLNSHKTSE